MGVSCIEWLVSDERVTYFRLCLRLLRTLNIIAELEISLTTALPCLTVSRYRDSGLPSPDLMSTSWQ
jgi:hypothetical protein